MTMTDHPDRAARLARRQADLETYRNLLAAEPPGPTIADIDDACGTLKRLFDDFSGRGHYLTHLVGDGDDAAADELAAAQVELAAQRAAADVFVHWFEGDAADGLDVRAGLTRSVAYALMGTERLRRAIQVAQMTQERP